MKVSVLREKKTQLGVCQTYEDLGTLDIKPSHLPRVGDFLYLEEFNGNSKGTVVLRIVRKYKAPTVQLPTSFHPEDVEIIVG